MRINEWKYDSDRSCPPWDDRILLGRRNIFYSFPTNIVAGVRRFRNDEDQKCETKLNRTIFYIETSWIFITEKIYYSLKKKRTIKNSILIFQKISLNPRLCSYRNWLERMFETWWILREKLPSPSYRFRIFYYVNDLEGKKSFPRIPQSPLPSIKLKAGRFWVRSRVLHGSGCT